jgi:hypothetical protein
MLTPPLEGKQLNGVSKGGEHPLCQFAIASGVKTPLAKWLRLMERIQARCALNSQFRSKIRLQSSFAADGEKNPGNFAKDSGRRPDGVISFSKQGET